MSDTTPQGEVLLGTTTGRPRDPKKGGRPLKFNWAAIRKDYEQTRMSGREIAERWRVDPALVYKHAVAEGWQRVEDYKPSFANFMDDDGYSLSSPYSVMHRDYLLEQIAYGRPMRSICAEPGMPTEQSVYYWLQRDEVFRQKYFDAKEIAGLVHGEKIIDVNSEIDSRLEDLSAAQVSALKLKSDNYKWSASKLAPKMYGDKSKVDVTSNDETIGGISVVFGGGDGEADTES